MRHDIALDLSFIEAFHNLVSFKLITHSIGKPGLLLMLFPVKCNDQTLRHIAFTRKIEVPVFAKEVAANSSLCKIRTVYVGHSSIGIAKDYAY